MARKLKISVHRNGERLHLKLRGDFDGTSAHELLSALNTHTNHAMARVFMHTSSLSMIHPFGLDVFHGNPSSIEGKSLDLVFTGESASRLAPQEPGRPGLNITAEPPLDNYRKTGSASGSGKAG